MAEANDDREWLPEDGILRLTALEVGALRGMLEAYRGEHPQTVTSFLVMVRGREKPVPMIDHLIEKVEAIHEELMRTFPLGPKPADAP